MPKKLRRLRGMQQPLRQRKRNDSSGFTGVTTRKGATFPYVELLTKASTSNQINDPFSNKTAFGQGSVIDPLFPFDRLCQLPLENNILRQCIESYVTNIESYGHVLEYVGEEGGENRPEVQEEKKRINSFLSAVAPDNTLREVREKSRWDKETLGNCFFEISRNLSGEIVMLDHIPGSTMRMTKRDTEPTTIEIIQRDPDGEGFIAVVVDKCFRRFVQAGPNGKKVYFKEFGDPRSIDPKTGEVDNSLSVEDQATEVLHRAIYTPGSSYGIPRWIGQLPAILGSRESETVNLNFFRENAIPAMAVLISGGALTEDSFERIEQYISAVRGRDAMQRVMVLEAAADDAAGSIDHSQPAPKIEMEPMLSERQQDGLFQEYDQKNMQKIRSAFRLPPIFVGRAEDYTRASALASILVAESQIFWPERSGFDDLMNNNILITFQPQFWRFKSIGPSLAEPESLTRMIDSFGGQGALTPNAVIKIANKMLDVSIDPILESWGDVPFSIVVENIKQGNMVDGLEDFIERIPDEAIEDDGRENTPNTPLPIAARRTIKKELRMIKQDMQELVSTVQTFARREKSNSE